MVIKIEYLFNEKCGPCEYMCNGLIPTRVLLAAQKIDVTFEKINVDVEDAPKLRFYKDGNKISELTGLPLNENPKLNALTIMMFVLKGIYDCSKDPRVRRLLDIGDEIYQSVLK